MIIWINGAFGSGKSTVARELGKALDDSFLFDPENMGFYLRENLPKELKRDDFQDISLWRDLNFEMLSYMANHYNGKIIVPMTLVNPHYFERVVPRLQKEGIPVLHFSLVASKETLLKRLESRGDSEDSWPARQIDRCIEGLSHERFKEFIHTDDLSIGDVAQTILASIKVQSRN